jgi:epoxyqueuosine reductase
VKARSTTEIAYAPREGLYAPHLIPLLSLDEEEFQRRFKGSPVLRAKRKGLLRNVAVALGNAKSVEALPALILALDDQEALVRGHVAWAIGRIGTSDAIKALERRRSIENDATVRAEIEAAIEEASSLALEEPKT